MQKEQFEKLEAMLPLIRQAAAESEQLGKLRADVLQQLFELGVFRLYISESLNGQPVDLPTSLKVFEKIAYADGATGWIAMIGAGGGLFSGFFEAEAAQEIFAPENSVIAGSGMPLGKAKKVAGGYQVSGRWPYASGAAHARFFTANCMLEASENEMISVAMPADQVEIHKAWDVLGMKATGSEDFSVEEVFVPEKHRFSLFSEPKLQDPIYRCPLEALAGLSFASVAIGIAQHAFEVFDAFSEEKVMMGSTSVLAEDEDVMLRKQSSKALIDQARIQLYDLAEHLWADLLAEDLQVAFLDKVRDNTIEIVRDSVASVDRLYARAGMMPLFSDSEFGRAWRDLHTLSQNAVVSPR